MQKALKMTTNDWKIVFYIIIGLSIAGIFFFLGRKTVKIPKPEVKIEYIKGDIIHDSIPYPVPYKVAEPIDTVNIIKQCIKDGIYSELWPTKTVTEYVEVSKNDTTAIMTDWATKRHYAETIFDCDTLGSCKINAEVQYNRLMGIEYQYTPVSKRITETKYQIKLFSPYIGAGYLVNPWDNLKDPTMVVNGGFFIKEKYGFQIQYQHGFNSKNDFIGGGVIYKF